MADVDDRLLLEEVSSNPRELSLLNDSVPDRIGRFIPRFDLEVNMQRLHNSATSMRRLEIETTEPIEDFVVTFIESESAEMVHRFIRIRDIEEDRQVLVENAIERYLVQLDETLTDVFQGTEKEQKLLYSCLKEDTPQEGDNGRCFTFMMILKETHSRPVENRVPKPGQMISLLYSQMTTVQKQTSFWAKDFLRFTQGLYDSSSLQSILSTKIKFLETRTLF